MRFDELIARLHVADEEALAITAIMMYTEPGGQEVVVGAEAGTR